MEVLMNRKMCVMTAAVLGWPVCVLGAVPAEAPKGAAQDQPARQDTTPRRDDATRRSGVTVDSPRPYDGPKLVWHTDAKPADTRDARVDFGHGMKISTPDSRPGWPHGHAA